MKKQIIKQLVLGTTLIGSLLAPMIVKAEEYPGGVNVYYEHAGGTLINGNADDIDSNDIVLDNVMINGLGLYDNGDTLTELKDNKKNYVFYGGDSALGGSYSGLLGFARDIALTTYKYRYKNDPETYKKKYFAMIKMNPEFDRDIIEFVNNHIITKTIPDRDFLWYYDHHMDGPETYKGMFNGVEGEPLGTLSNEESKIIYRYNEDDDDYVENVRRDLKNLYADLDAKRKAFYAAKDAGYKANAAAWNALNSSNSGSSASGSSGSSSTSGSTRSKRSADTTATTTVGSAGTWTKEGSNWKLIKPDGSIARGWVMDNGKWYFLDPVSGNMRIGWSKDGDNWYFLNPDGSMATNWVHHGDSWYYLQGSGVMARGWIKSGNDWYFLSESGSMLKSTLTPDGYKLDASGKWVQ